MPCGFGDANSFSRLFKANQNGVRQFVRNGGKYLGICMGAYWAGIDYFDVAVDLTIGQYIERPTSDIDYEGPTVANVIWNGSSETMYFYDGCAIIGDDNMDIVAKYANGDAMAIIQGNIGIIGCHPEAQQWW